MSDATEHEMLERLVDATRSAADRIQDACRALMLNAPIAPRTLTELRHSLRQASGSAHQLGHAQQNPAFWGLRDALDGVGQTVTAAALSRSEASGMALAQVGSLLDRLWQEARKKATGKAVTRADALAMVDARQKAIVT